MAQHGVLAARRDPSLAFRFQVEIDGLLIAGFSEASGVEIQIDVDEYHEGGTNHFMHHLPKSTRHSNLVLKRGLTPKDSILWDWLEHVRQGHVERRSGRVVLMNARFEEEDHFRFVDAFPVRIQLGELSGTSDSIVTETLELAHNGLVRSSL